MFFVLHCCQGTRKERRNSRKEEQEGGGGKRKKEEGRRASLSLFPSSSSSSNTTAIVMCLGWAGGGGEELVDWSGWPTLLLRFQPPQNLFLLLSLFPPFPPPQDFLLPHPIQFFPWR